MQYEPTTTLGDLALTHHQCLAKSEILHGWAEQEGVDPITFLIIRDELAEEVFIRLLELVGYDFEGECCLEPETPEDF